MIYLKLFWDFFKVSCFTFGGAYGAIPLIRDMVLRNGWISEEQLTYMIAVSESTPGPIMVNVATYVGSTQAGFLGSLIATLSVVLPSFFIILLVTMILKNAMKNKYVQAVLRGMKPCIIGIILATGIYMTVTHCIAAESADIRAIIITVLLAAIMFGLPKLRKKPVPPTVLILTSAVLGMAAYAI